MRRFLLPALFSLALASAALAGKPYIKIGDQKMFLAYTPGLAANGLREYLPAGETLGNWARLASVRVFPDLDDPAAFLKKVADGVKRSHPAARYQLLEAKGGGPLVLDFLTFPPEGSRDNYAEWNLMRAKHVEGKGLAVYQYAMRIYGPSENSASEIKAERAKMLDPFVAATFQEK